MPLAIQRPRELPFRGVVSQRGGKHRRVDDDHY